VVTGPFGILHLLQTSSAVSSSNNIIADDDDFNDDEWMATPPTTTRQPTKLVTRGPKAAIPRCLGRLTDSDTMVGWRLRESPADKYVRRSLRMTQNTFKESILGLATTTTTTTTTTL
jgi:hypothetical protein